MRDAWSKARWPWIAWGTYTAPPPAAPAVALASPSGVVFRLAPQKNGSWKYNVIYELNETTGGVQPFYGVILDGKGNLFGVTSSSGTYGSGTAFEISP